MTGRDRTTGMLSHQKAIVKPDAAIRLADFKLVSSLVGISGEKFGLAWKFETEGSQS